MKLRESRYRSVQKKNHILKGLEILLCVCTAVMWLSRERLGLEKADMLIFTGFTVFVVSVSLINNAAFCRNKQDDGHIDKLRDEIGTENYKDSSVFFK